MTEAWLTDPLALQMLYRIAREPRDIVGDLDAGWGSGDQQPRIRLDRRRIDAVEHNLHSTELVRRARDRWEFEVTELGYAFLEIIGPECDDPDMSADRNSAAARNHVSQHVLTRQPRRR